MELELELEWCRSRTDFVVVNGACAAGSVPLPLPLGWDFLFVSFYMPPCDSRQLCLHTLSLS